MSIKICSLEWMSNNNRFHILFGLLTLILVATGLQTSAQEADSIAQLMFDRTRGLKTLSYVMTKEERIDGKMLEQVSFVKLNREPFKVYTKQLSPDEGIEVLYIGGNKTALINPNGFPWFNVKLDPHGTKMTKDQHHTIFDSGFDRFVSILQFLFQKYGDEIESMATIKEIIDDKGRACWLLEFNNPHYKITNHKLGKDEDLLTISDTKFISPYKILTLNEDVDSYTDVSEGQLIKIPNDYSPKMTLLIDKYQQIPLEITVYDEHGLFEHYLFSKIKLDPPFKEIEFTPEYSAYGF